MKRDPRVYLDDILDAMNKAEMFVAGMSYEQFENDLRTHYAVTRALEIVGEATRRLADSFREQYPDVPWRDMAGMRDRIIHGYDNVNLRIVWDVVKQDIPQVRPLIEQILTDLEDQSTTEPGTA
jgi:uncharacterized protein with HEPN domain